MRLDGAAAEVAATGVGQLEGLRAVQQRLRAVWLLVAVALPIIVGATALKGTRLVGRGTTPEMRRSLGVGVAASFASTLASQRLIRLVERDRALWPYAAYRAGLAALVLRRLSKASLRFGYTSKSLDEFG